MDYKNIMKHRLAIVQIAVDAADALDQGFFDDSEQGPDWDTAMAYGFHKLDQYMNSTLHEKEFRDIAKREAAEDLYEKIYHFTTEWF